MTKTAQDNKRQPLEKIDEGEGECKGEGECEKIDEGEGENIHV
ncbi:hypothetical protein MCHI_002015 [Candidatus Magnetoovum chiemensis]|nr:hypothetical protein MCHI_002015 [Candidatus Magnetoovum chiemensis]